MEKFMEQNSIFDYNKNETEFTLSSKLSSRLRNINLQPKDVMFILYEAISNSINSLIDRYKNDYDKKGEIIINLIKDKSSNLISTISIEDNGIGFDSINFNSFLEMDSEHQKDKGGKGIGRLDYLKACKNVKIESSYTENNSTYKRQFNFSDKEKPIYDHKLEQIYTNNLKTIVTLEEIKESYSKYFSNNLEEIVNLIINHFITIFASGRPNITFIMENETCNLKELWNNNTYRLGTETIPYNSSETITLDNFMIDINLAKSNKIYLSANKRTVNSFESTNKLGIDAKLKYKDKYCYYIGVISSNELDRMVSPDRTYINIPKEMEDKIKNLVFCNLKTNILKNYYEEAISHQVELVKTAILRHPMYKSAVENPRDFVKNGKVSPSSKNEEAILQDIVVQSLRKEKQIAKELKNPDINISNNALKNITQFSKDALAEYVCRRKEVLDTLSKRLEYKDAESKSKYLEKDIHEVICPMQIDSNDIATIENHNLWVLDDRLAYYEYWASDKKMNKFISDKSKTKRPDIILFNGCSVFQRERSNQPVVIIEFKRPERNDYTEEENPIKQVMSYIDDLKNQQIHTNKGKLITSISKETLFQCYIICDITSKLEEFMNYCGGFKKYPDGHGFRSYREEFNAIIDIIPFDSLILDAELRNEIFFEKLKLK